MKKLVKTGNIRQVANKKSDSKKCAERGLRNMESAKIKEPNPIKKSLKRKPDNMLGTAKAAKDPVIFQPDSPTPVIKGVEKFSSPSKTKRAKLSLYSIVNNAACEISVIISKPSK